MQILITGATGFIGTTLLKSLSTHQLVLLTRDRAKAKQKLAHIDHGNIRYIGELEELADLNEFDAVINLAGEPIADKRWTQKQKERICYSRWVTTEKLVALCNASSTPPNVFISGSAVGYYGDQKHTECDEDQVVDIDTFPHRVCAQWENIALGAQSQHTRVCLLRTGVVLAPHGGALKKMLLPYQLGLGGPIAQGEQFMAWIHMQDMVQAIMYLLEHPKAQGPFNLCAPHPVTNREFSKTLAQTLSRPHVLFTPKWLIRLLMGESADLLCDSTCAKPKRLTEIGFQFTYPRLKPALKQLLLTHNHDK